MAASIPIRQCRFFCLYPRFALCVKTNKMRTNVFTSNYKNSVFFGESGDVAEKAASLSAQNPRLPTRNPLDFWPLSCRRMPSSRQVKLFQSQTAFDLFFI